MASHEPNDFELNAGTPGDDHQRLEHAMSQAQPAPLGVSTGLVMYHSGHELGYSKGRLAARRTVTRLSMLAASAIAVSLLGLAGWLRSPSTVEKIVYLPQPGGSQASGMSSSGDVEADAEPSADPPIEAPATDRNPGFATAVADWLGLGKRNDQTVSLEYPSEDFEFYAVEPMLSAGALLDEQPDPESF